MRFPKSWKDKYVEFYEENSFYNSAIVAKMLTFTQTNFLKYKFFT